jgi:hypothetical protein
MVHSAFRLLGIAIVSGRGNSTATSVAEILLTRHAAPLSEVLNSSARVRKS